MEFIRKGKETERRRCISAAKNCMEKYTGGYHGNELEIYLHGMQTVINSLGNVFPSLSEKKKIY